MTVQRPTSNNVSCQFNKTEQAYSVKWLRRPGANLLFQIRSAELVAGFDWLIIKLIKRSVVNNFSSFSHNWWTRKKAESRFFFHCNQLKSNTFKFFLCFLCLFAAISHSTIYHLRLTLTMQLWGWQAEQQYCDYLCANNHIFRPNNVHQSTKLARNILTTNPIGGKLFYYENRYLFEIILISQITFKFVCFFCGLVSW